LEKTATIGILKALGASDKLIRKTFVHLASYLILKGLLWGNIIGLSICAIQYFTGIFKLDAATYYISEVPIEINWWLLILLNIGALALLMLMVTLPTHIISKIKPAETIRFE
jgi:lipoprotein-releasing system permease protein